MTQAPILNAFDTIARGLLDRYDNDPLRALPPLRKILMKRSDLLDALALARLTFLTSASPGQTKGDVLRQATEEETAAGQDPDDAQVRIAGGGTPSTAPALKAARKPIKVREHRRARQRTDEDRALERTAMAQSLVGVFTRPVLGRAIGQYRWRELPELRRVLTMQTIDHLLLGRRVGEDAILVDRLLCYATAVDPDALVSDVVSAADFAELEIAASREALPKLDMSKGAAHAEFVRQLDYQSPAS